MVLEDLKEESRTMILYEAPHHLKGTLKELKDALGNRKITLCRELTKKFEEYIRGNISEIIPICESLKGEMVLVVKGYQQEESVETLTEEELVMLVEKLVIEGMQTTKAIKQISQRYNVSRQELYQSYLSLVKGE